MDTMISAALAYAAKGWPVFPCEPAGKYPIAHLAPQGFKNATTDPAIIRDWWARVPDANIGLALSAAGMMAVDADIYKPDCQFEAWNAEHPLPDTLTQRSARGGTHFLFQAEPGAKYLGKPAFGVDGKHNGYILLAPSRFAGGAYAWQNDLPPAPAPAHLKRPERKLTEVSGNTTGASGRTLAEAEDALRHISPDLPYDDWMAVLMGLHDEFGDDAVQLAEEWTANFKDPTHSHRPGMVDYKFASFTASDDPGRVTISTLFKMARDGGADLGQLRHQHTDMSQFFHPVPPAEPTIFEQIAARETVAVAQTLQLPFTPWRAMDLARIPSPSFLYSDFYARGYTSLTVASPKVGKSMLGLAEAIDAATGRGFLTGRPAEPRRVVYYNAEDDQDVLNARVAALLVEYGIDQSEIEGRLFASSGVSQEAFYLATGAEGTINEALFSALEQFVRDERIDVLIFDPLQDMTLSPETNEVFRALGQRLRRMASTTRVAVGLIHHLRKVAPGMAATIDDARGGSALRGTARFNRVLVPMTPEEAEKAGVADHRHFLRIADAESNLAPPSAEVNRWFEKVSVAVPNGSRVGAVRAWQWPDAMDGLAECEVDILAAIEAGAPDGERYSARPQDTERWAGDVVMSVSAKHGVAKTEEQAKGIIKAWIDAGALQVRDYKSPTQRKTRRGLYVKMAPAADVFG